MLSQSVNSFLRKNQKKPDVEQSQSCKDKLIELNSDLTEYSWKMHKLQQATKNKNTEAVANKIDNKYMPAWKECKSKQIQQLQTQVERLKATSEAMND